VRKQYGVTLGGLAKHLNVSIPYVSDVESERRGPFNENNLSRLSSLFGDLGIQLAENARRQRGRIELDIEAASEQKIATGLLLAEVWPNLTEGDAGRLKALLYDLT
jgi:transcriptional regulator with XRE-family HTH domain